MLGSVTWETVSLHNGTRPSYFYVYGCPNRSNRISPARCDNPCVNVRQWVDLGKETIVRLLQAEYAAVWPEIEAKCADWPYPPNRYPIQPHHLTTARKELRTEGVTRELSDITRGGRDIPYITLREVDRETEAIKEAAARKRLLQARYLSWAVTLQLLGPAGENAAHAALMTVAPQAGYRVVRPEGGNVAGLFGQPVEGGPLDDAAHLQVVDNRGIGTGVVTVPIEVKNVREWIYADSARLHQLLYKAARLQQRFPDVGIVPVQVCRRAAYNTFKMARAFGFYVANANAQFLPQREDVTPTAVEEVRVGLGYRDLTQATEPNRLLMAHFGRSLPKVSQRAAKDWAVYGPLFAEHFDRLRDPSLPRAKRAELANELEHDAGEILGEQEEEEQPEWEPPFPGDYY